MQLNNSSVRGFNLGEHWSLDNYIVEISGHSQISGGVCLPSYVGKQTLSFRTSRGARGQYLSYHATYHGIGQSPKPSMLNYDGDSAEASNNHHRARKIEWRLTVHFFFERAFETPPLRNNRRIFAEIFTFLRLLLHPALVVVVVVVNFVCHYFHVGYSVLSLEISGPGQRQLFPPCPSTVVSPTTIGPFASHFSRLKVFFKASQRISA